MLYHELGPDCAVAIFIENFFNPLQVADLRFNERTKRIAQLWNTLPQKEKAVFQNDAKSDKSRHDAEDADWSAFVDKWMVRVQSGQQEPTMSKRFERTDEVLAQRREEADNAKRRKIEKEEKKKALEAARANGTAATKMSVQQLHNRKMKEAFENSVKRRATFYSEVTALFLVTFSTVVCPSAWQRD
jgi:hypothetical protein